MKNSTDFSNERLRIKSTFSVLPNTLLQEKLQWLIGEYSISQIFYRQEKKSAKSHIVVIVSQSADVKKLRSGKWIAEVREQYQCYVYFIDCSRLEYQISKGHPFIKYYCQQSSMICQNEDSRSSLLINRNWIKYSKKFNRYEDTFHHDHEIQRIQVERLISEDSYNSVFTSFEKLIEYDLEYLEELFTGNRTIDIDLKTRINILLIYIPELKQYFVKKNQYEYYITELFDKAKKAIKDEDIIFDNEMFESLRIIQNSLFIMIEARFYELKHLIKKQCDQICQINSNLFPLDENRKDDILEKAIDRILTFVELEQIYFFYKTTYGDVTTYYLLLIGSNLSNEKLKSINQSLKSVFGNEYSFTLLGHDRYWIQKNLYQSQHFFAHLMQSRHLVFTSDEYHPEPHWQFPHHPQHNDLYFHYRVTLESALQFQKLLEGEKENYQGLSNIFSLFFLSFCRTYLFVKTYYLPNYLTSEALWHLCIYADGHMQKYSYLIGHFYTDIFTFIDYHRSVHHQVAHINQEKAGQMKTMVEMLMCELKKEVINGNLLNDHELSCIKQ